MMGPQLPTRIVTLLKQVQSVACDVMCDHVIYKTFSNTNIQNFIGKFTEKFYFKYHKVEVLH